MILKLLVMTISFGDIIFNAFAFQPSLQYLAERIELGIAAMTGDIDVEILQSLVGFQLRRV